MSKNIRKPIQYQRLIFTFMALSIALIAFLTYAHMLKYFFTGSDSLTLIDTSRIQSLEDARKIFTQPLMSGTWFVNTALFYRPIASLSYSLDYYFWGLNPFGYHLTDLVLHVIVSILVLKLMLLLTRGRKSVSWLSAAIFTTHPILVECVPVIARRQDIIVALFLLLSQVLFVKYILNPIRRLNWVMLYSILAYAFALGTKEIAVLQPLIICGYLFIFFSHIPEDTHKSIRLKSAQMYLSFLLAVTLVYIVWRAYVLQGIGGYENQNFTSSETLWFSLNTSKSYISNLLYPVSINYIIPKSLARVLFSVDEMILACLSISLTISVASLFLTSGTNQMKSLSSKYGIGKTMAFLLLWLLAPLCFFLVTRTFDHRYMYIPVIPFSALISIVLVENLQIVIHRLAIRQSATNFHWKQYAASGSFILTSGLVIYFLSFSPLIRTYREWEDNGNLSSMILQKLSNVVNDLPNHQNTNYTIRIRNLPAGITTDKTGIPHVKSVNYLEKYSIKSYLDLTYPNNQIEVVISHRVTLSRFPRNIDLEYTIKEKNNVIITIAPSKK